MITSCGKVMGSAYSLQNQNACSRGKVEYALAGVSGGLTIVMMVLALMAKRCGLQVLRPPLV